MLGIENIKTGKIHLRVKTVISHGSLIDAI